MRTNQTNLLVIAALGVCSALGAAQTPPNFSGIWKCDDKRSTRCNRDTMIVEHRGETMTVQRSGEPPVTASYALDGTPTTSGSTPQFAPDGRRMLTVPLRHTARWEGSTLTIRTRSIEASPIDASATWRLSDDGFELTIEERWTKAGSRGASRRIWTREEVYDVGSGVTAPVVIRDVKPTYSAAAMRAKIQGKVEMRAVVLRDGHVGLVEVITSLDPQLDRQAVIALRQWEFKPGTRHGKPVAVRITCDMAFSTPK